MMGVIDVDDLGVKSHKVNTALMTSVGHFSIKGTTKKTGISLPCVVRLYERISGQLVESLLSDKLGNYSFFNVKKNTKYYVMAIDPNSQYNAVIQDNVVPK